MKKELLNQISEYTNATGSVVIEAAHIYADQQVGKEQVIGAVLAAEIVACITRPIHRMLLIDDIHTKDNSLDLAEYRSFLTHNGFDIDELVLESVLNSQAYDLLRQIKEVIPKKKLWQPKNDFYESMALGMWTRNGKVSLLDADHKPSCHLLDAAFYIDKAKKASLAITVLPSQYIPQQQKTLSILERINMNFNILNVFFDQSNPEIITIFSNGKEVA